MAEKGFRRPHGRRVRGPGGYEAFVPAPLPPPLDWPPELATKLSEADRAIGQLAGEGRRLPNPHLLIRPFIRREAVLSSRIEGTQATLGELLAAEAGASFTRVPADLREVENYVAALEYGIWRLDTFPLSLRLIRELHGRLMKGVRGDVATPGEFRRTQNWIGTPGSSLTNATYVPPPPDVLAECLADLEKYLHDKTLPPLVHVALTHSQFEAIHPFLDGNGRVGRLLITLLLVQRDVLPAPLLYLSAYFEATRNEYYDRLLGVTNRGEWESWLEYFLRAVEHQSKDAIGRIQRIDALLAQWRDQLSEKSSKTGDRALDELAQNPFTSVKSMATRLKVAFTTAQRVVDRLEGAGVIALVSGTKRNRVYCAQKLLAILEEPPALGRRR